MGIEKKITVLYGSQTGTAREMAESLWRRTKKLGFAGAVMAMDEYDVRNLIRENVVLFVCSTTGVGEEPDNMKTFWRFLLRRNLPVDSLSGLNYAVLGLGDTTYANFNFPAKKLDKRLAQLGGKRINQIGLCDYQHDFGHDTIAEPWIITLWSNLKSIFPDVDFTESSDNVDFLPRWNVHVVQNGENDFQKEELYSYECQEKIEVSKRPFIMKLKNNTRTTADDHFQDVRLLEFEPVDEKFPDYDPGDVLYLRPKNSEQDIYVFFEIFEHHKLRLKPGDVIDVSSIYKDMPVPKALSKPTALYNIVEQLWDLREIPKKYAFSVLASVSKNSLERNKCIRLSSAEGQEELFDYCNRPRRNILEVLTDFHCSTSELTLEHLFELFSWIKPRPFSIASSCKAFGNKQIDLLVAVVRYFTKLLKAERLGLCSNWLKNLSVGDGVIAWIRKGSFIFPNEKDTPVLMIGPGTGLAPFRSYIMEKELNKEASSDKLMLLFGCRNEHGDFHCGEYLKKLQSNNQLTLLCAFSRDQDNKIYVQHKIEENSSLFWDWICNRKAQMYIAGSSKNMPDGVKGSIVENVFCKHRSMDKKDAEITLKTMETDGRLQLETW